MSEIKSGPPAPEPPIQTARHTLEVYVQHGLGAETLRYWYSHTEDAEEAYDKVTSFIERRQSRENGVPDSIEIADDFGRGHLAVRDIGGCRLVNAEYHDWMLAVAVEARAKGAL